MDSPAASGPTEGTKTMTKGEEKTIRNLIERLQKPDCGCSLPTAFSGAIRQMVALRAEMQSDRVEIVSRIYLDTWVIPSLAMLLPEDRDVDLAEKMSR